MNLGHRFRFMASRKLDAGPIVPPGREAGGQITIIGAGVMRACVCGYAAYPLSLRHIEEMMAERGVLVDHATVHRWAMKVLPVPALHLTARRDVAAARRFFERAIDPHDVPESIALDKSGVNTAAVRGLLADGGAAIERRQSKHLNNVIKKRQLGCP